KEIEYMFKFEIRTKLAFAFLIIILFIILSGFAVILQIQHRNFLISIFLFIIIFIILVTINSLQSISKMISGMERLANVSEKNLSIIIPVLRKISTGDLTQKLKISDPKDEFTELLIVLNSMIDDLRKAKRIQEEYTIELKKKVDERTKELAEKVIDLKRTQEAILNVVEDLDIKSREISEAKSKNEAILASIADAVMACDKNGNIIIFNSMAEKITGFSAEQVMGGHYSNYFKLVAYDGKMINKEDCGIEEVIKTGKEANVTKDNLLLRKDGKKIPIAKSASPVKNEKGMTIGCVSVFRDVSEERKIDKAKSEFVSLVSHQLRTPLTAISWFTELLLSQGIGKLNKKQKDYLKEVYGSNRRMIDLVGALLNVSRIELGTLAITLKPTNFIDIVKISIKELVSQANKKKIKIKTEFDKNLPIINADPNLIKIVFQNVISNAVKYTHEQGEVRISLRKHEKNILFKIKDNGYGIPKNQQSKIFSKLFRADNVAIIETNGSGLGLYVAKFVVEQSGGRIWFESEENKGTTFYISIPIKGMKAQEGVKGLISV
ncbi:ATP-binding protein, partial [Patescibacteria group bacterium]